jgi:4'-phosphopantetheinyl transferase superfamily
MTPEVRLLDARSAGVDESGLRAWARAQTASSDARFVTRSYRYPYALIAWHDGPVGIRVERCDAAFVESICTPVERSAWPAGGDCDTTAISFWCSKEALAKALGDALAYDPRRLESPLGWPAGRSGAWRAECLPTPPGHVGWLCWR